jgi:hypothetical protein
MRRSVLSSLLVAIAATSLSGCFVNQYSSDPIRRSRQLFNQSEDLRLLEDDWERFWMVDQPSNMSLKRYHGTGDPSARRLPYKRKTPFTAP